MRNPVTTTAGHLLWSRSGTVWAVYRLRPLPYGYRSVSDKRAVRTAHTLLLRALRGESLLMGLCARIDPVTVVERMIDDVDLTHCPEWAAECDATLDFLEAVSLGERSFWLALPLEPAGTQRVSAPMRASFAELRDLLSLPRWTPSALDVERARATAEDLVNACVPAVFAPRPATAAEMAWIAAHHKRRGLSEDPAPEFDSPAPDSDELALRIGSATARALLDEGGQGDLARRGAFNPLTRRFLKVSDPCAPGRWTDDGDHDVPADPDDPSDTAAPGTDLDVASEASYQCFLTLDDVPVGGMVFPGSEFLGDLDASGVDADWWVRLTVKTSDVAAKRIRKAVRDLNDQFAQRDGSLVTGHHELDGAASMLQEFEKELNADRSEVQVEATVVFAVAAATRAAAEDQARDLQQHFQAAQYNVGRPVGAQETLWWAGQPGVPTTANVRQFAQITTAHHFAAAAPVISTELGDRKGILLGLNISSGRPGPVHLDLESTVVDQNASPAVAMAGELGAGKTLFLKKVSSQLVDRHGRMLAIDRTAQGEWAALAAQITEATTVNVASPTVSLDVLRLFPGPAGARIAQSCLTALFNASPSSPQGRLLADVLDPAWLFANGVNSLGQLDQHLQRNRDLPGSDELASTLRAFSRKDFGRVLFDPNLPPLRLDSRAIVFLTAGLQLPTREELLHEHLFKQMRLERVFGRALYALIMGVVRHAAFADPSEMVTVALSEAHHITSSPEAADEVIELIRDGRKHKAAALLDSHDPLADFGDETLRGLIPTRLVGRQTDRNLARNSLEWLGLDPEDPQLLQLLTTDTSPVNPVTGEVPLERRGEALMRDSKNRYGLVKILAPNDPSRRQAVMTTPPAARTTAATRRAGAATPRALHPVPAPSPGPRPNNGAAPSRPPSREQPDPERPPAPRAGRRPRPQGT